ncbi:MAG: tRNA (guanosine(37)-N1)-methyltransferase TrmD [Deltaproteobacteria bacterium]|nr:MAG: tRNA (guanosine(37)-N1)-methyltransferase TrmD [Deltaproteobacteria bacterium]
MNWYVLTLFPEMFDSVLSASLFGKAIERGIIRVELVDFRRWGVGRHKVVDDEPFGGGAGMVLKPEPIAAAIDWLRERVPSVHVVMLTPQGRTFRQPDAHRLAGMGHVALLCGRYEGFDDRVRQLVDEELSIGDFVLSGGEAAAWVVMEAASRLVEGVVGDAESLRRESFSENGLLDYPQYTRPRQFRGMKVPDVLLSGNHEAIEKWRRAKALERTLERRPELAATAGQDEKIVESRRKR